MRKKNRQVKMTLDIPEQFKDDDDFLDAFGEKLDEVGWNFVLMDETDVPVTRVTLGDKEIVPEEEE